MTSGRGVFANFWWLATFKCTLSGARFSKLLFVRRWCYHKLFEARIVKRAPDYA
jgi:hypothetical protein